MPSSCPWLPAGITDRLLQERFSAAHRKVQRSVTPARVSAARDIESRSCVLVPEREDTVRVDIFAAYQALLTGTAPSSKMQLTDKDSMEVAER